VTAKRVVITGLGAATPLGLTVPEMWNGLAKGKCGITEIKAFDPAGFACKLAGQVPDFKIRDHVPKTHRKATKMMCRDIELAVVAANEALKDSGIVTKASDEENINIDPTRFAINLGAGLISCDLVELAPAIAKSLTDGNFDIKKWGEDGLQMVTPLWLLKYLPNMLACHVGIIHDIQGPSNTITCAEASAHIAIAEAAQIIARDAADIALAGAAEAKVNPIVMIRQNLIGRTTSQHNEDPDAACRPFDTDATGSVFGEAAGIIVLESLDNAQQRGAEIYAEIAGTGQSNNINPQFEKLESDGEGIRIAIEKALEDAEIESEDLDLIVPHGTGVPADDQAEAAAIEAALGNAITDIHVWPTKSMLSTTGAASGAVDVIAASCAMKNKTIPAVKNCDNKASSCQLNIVTKPQQKEIRYALGTSYTYGSQAAAVVLKNAGT
jgi:3-oxoacyl-[acyl-carrier-protein] synthase II